MNHINYLISLGACQSDIDMVAKFPSLSEAWEACENPQYMLWLLRAAGAIVKAQAVDIAIQCAERRLSDCEKKHPNDDTARAAIDAAKAWLKDPTEDNRQAAGDAACNAYAACYAYAAFAAFAADAAFADAVNDAVAYAAAFADADAECKIQSDIIRAVVGNPFKDI